jgi:hypothetical protein
VRYFDAWFLAAVVLSIVASATIAHCTRDDLPTTEERR